MIYSFTVKSNLSRGSGQWNSEKHSSSQCFITVLYNHPDHSSAQSKSLLSHLWPRSPVPLQSSSLHVMYGAVISIAVQTVRYVEF